MSKIVLQNIQNFDGLITDIIGMDTNNLIANNPALPYTATQDCYASVYYDASGYSGNISVDDVVIGTLGTNYAATGKHSISTTIMPLKEGQVLNVTNYTTIRIFGEYYG